MSKLEVGQVIVIRGEEWEIIKKVTKPYSLVKLRSLVTQVERIVPIPILAEMIGGN